MGMKYDVKTITMEEFRELIASGNDKYDNQVRVSKAGEVYLSQDIVGAEQIDDVICRFESFDARNDYVGMAASQDDIHVRRMYNALIRNRDNNFRETYLDMWNNVNFD